MSDLTLVLGPSYARFSKRIASADDITAADRLPLLLEFEDADIHDISDLHEILNLLRPQRNTCIIRGQLLPGVEQPCRRLLIDRVENGTTYTATIEDVPRAWLMVDFDSIVEPATLDFATEPAACAEYLRTLLPPEFHTARCVWRASGSAGFKPGIRLHLWFLLDRAIDGADCKAWTSHTLVKVDRTVYGAVQPHFTADPELAPGVEDPMSERIGLLEGALERVHVPTEIPADLSIRSHVRKLSSSSEAATDDGRTLDPFVRVGLRKWDEANPWDGGTPDLSERFECPACGSSDGCCVLPDGKLFCHGGKHPINAPNIGHPANNGYVMHRFEAFEKCEWSQVTTRLQELGLYPGLPKSRRIALTQTQSEDVDAAVSAMTNAMSVETVDRRALKKAHKELKEAASLIRTDRARAEAITFDFARKFVPESLSAEAVREALVDTNGRAPLFDADVEAAIDRGLARAVTDPFVPTPSALHKDMYGKNEKCLANVVKLLHLPEFTNVLSWDVRARKKFVIAQPPWLVETNDTYPRPVLDTDYAAIAVYLADWLQYPHATSSVIAEALALATTANPIDPVLQYFEQLDAFEGDIDDAAMVAGSWLTEFAGAPDDEYTRAVAMRWLISAVARTYKPGCAQREVLTLVGPQNIGKSRLLAALCASPTWFKDDLWPERSDAAMSLLGKLVVELAELDKLVAGDRHGTVKAFISTNTDQYRRPYGREFEDVERRSVFAATSNVERLFRDPTGNTRFNVVELSGVIDVAGAAAARDELWSAARMLFKAGEQWWLTPTEQALAVARQDAHREVLDAEEWLRELVACTDKTKSRDFLPRQDTGQFVDGWQWLTSAQLVEYLRTKGVSRNLYRQVSHAMRALSWVAQKHVGEDLKNGPRGFTRK